MIAALRPHRLTVLFALTTGLTACGLPSRLVPPPDPPSQVLRLDSQTNLLEGSLRRGAVTAVITHRVTTKADGVQVLQPQLTVTVDGRVVGSLAGAEKHGGLSPSSLFQIVELDSGNPYPEVLLSSFTGGAHCCNATSVLSSDRTGRRWQQVNLGPFDGDLKPATDPLKTGTFLVEGVDNRFHYQFSSYAGSAPPPRLWQLQGMRFEDVTHQPQYVPLHRQRFQEMVRWFRQVSPDQEVNGFLAGYVATAALVGEFPAAWQTLLARYDRRSDWGLRQCFAGYDDQGGCRAPELVYPDFPSALAAFLVQTGYLSAPKR